METTLLFRFDVGKPVSQDPVMVMCTSLMFVCFLTDRPTEYRMIGSCYETATGGRGGQQKSFQFYRRSLIAASVDYLQRLR